MQLHTNRLLLVVAACLAISSAASAQNRPAPDLAKQPTLYVVGYAHLDTEWRWEYPQVINQYLKDTLDRNFSLFEKYPHYVFNFTGANRYRFFKEYYPADFEKLKKYVATGHWFPAGSSMEEGDVNAPNAEGIIRQVLYGNNWFRKELGTASAEYMIPDCFGFPASLPSILAHAGVQGFSTQKLVWGSSAPGGGPESLEKTPEGIPFNVGVWVGPDGRSVVAALNPGDYVGNVTTDLSKPLPAAGSLAALDEVMQKLRALPQVPAGAFDPDAQLRASLRAQQQALARLQREQNFSRYQGDWAARVQQNGKISGVFADYRYYGAGDIGGAPREDSVQLLEAIVTKGSGAVGAAAIPVGAGPVNVISAAADQLFLDLTPAEIAGLPRFTGEMELTNHSAGSLTSQAYVKRWLRKQETLADAAEKVSIAAEWLGGRKYPLERLNNAWTLAMGTHFHDIAAGTATPKSYEFAWNDQIISLNQFAGVLSSATQTVAAALNTQTVGRPVVVYNTLNVAREDIVEASVDLPAGTKAVRVVGPDGKEVAAQLSGGKVLFLAKAPSVGYAVYDVSPAPAAASASALKVSGLSLENQRYRVTIDGHGDISGIFDKSLNRELLSAPARLAISYDNPERWPAWNMDWDQEQAAPRSYVGGPVRVRVVEDGPVRIAVEIARETEGSRFVQTISLAAGDAGNRVEIANAIDWNTKEANLKAAFPLAASNQMATYNWDIGTIQRPTAEPRKFEVPSHQWVDLTDATGTFGATILTDCKNGSDKPRDNVIRLTLLRTPGTRGGPEYHDQGTQDLGHHEFVYGIAGHAGDWRQGQTDWQAYRLNQPLVAFETARHAGALGKELSLLKTGNPAIRVLAMKKAEQSDEVIVRLVETNGRPVDNVRVSFAAPLTAAREVNGQERPVGPATIAVGALVTSFTAYQPRTFAVKLATAPFKVAPVQSRPVTLAYDLAAATADGVKSSPGFDAQGRALAAAMLPGEIDFGGVIFKMGPMGAANALVAKGQSIGLPAGSFNRVYVLAASSDGDRTATFRAGEKAVELNVEDWGGFIGQWDDRVWQATKRDPYAEMVKIVPGYIKRADLAWYCDHRHSAAGVNEAYAYSYLFAYAIDLPAGAKTLTLPDDGKIRVLAVSVAQEGPGVRPVQPLYDTLER
jgi:alpha-mannosidase